MKKTATSRKRILLIEDHPLSRMGLVQLINQESDLEVCGEACDVPELWRIIEPSRPDLVIVDISLPSGSGIELVKDLKARYPHLLFLVLSMHDESLYAERALRAGARGYIMKEEAPELIRTAIRRVLAGEVFLSERAKARLLGSYLGGQSMPARSPVETLSDRELEVFALIGRGVSAKEAAERLRVSIPAVYGFRERIKEKLRLKNGGELALHAVRWVQEQGRS